MAQSSVSIQTDQRYNVVDAGSQHIASQLYDEDAYRLWHNLRRCAEFNECRREIFACIKAPADVFTYFYYLRTNPKAKEFTDALHMSIHFVPPENVWNAIVQIRKYPKYSSIRNLVLSEMAQGGPASPQQAIIKRESSASQRSRNQLSVISSNSARTSGISGNTSFAILEADEDFGIVHGSSSSDKVLPELPMAPGKGYRKAPAGHCFVCPLKECKGRWAYRRSGDYLNHMRNVHPSFPPHDPSNYLRKDVRVSTTPIDVKGEDLEEVPGVKALDSPNDSYPDLHALSDAPTQTSEQEVVVDDFQNFTSAPPMDFVGIAEMAGNYGHNEARPLFGEITDPTQFHPAIAQQLQSFFYHEDEMETG